MILFLIKLVVYASLLVAAGYWAYAIFMRLGSDIKDFRKSAAFADRAVIIFYWLTGIAAVGYIALFIRGLVLVITDFAKG